MKQRLDWIDFSRGFIVLWMVMYQCATRVGYTHPHSGWFFEAAQLGAPIRMQALFFISGLLFASSLTMTWQELWKKRISNLIYLFILWTVFAVVLHSNGVIGQIPNAFFNAVFIAPIISLWFIIVLPLFMLFAWVTRRFPPLLILAFAAGLEVMQFAPRWNYGDNFAHYLIYFLIGLYGKDVFTRLTSWLKERDKLSLLLLALFAAAHYYIVQHQLYKMQGFGLVWSLTALCAVLIFGLGLSKFKIFEIIQTIGANSLVFYLGYMPFMLIASLFLKSKIADPSLYASLLWSISVLGAYLLWQASQKLKLHFLYAKPW
jgi:uncharacterized membrane protein YcfT